MPIDLLRLHQSTTDRLAGIGSDVSLLLLRLILAFEFAEAGLEKLEGENWFAHVQDRFPFPFNVIPTDISWAMATWTEIIAAALLAAGLATRFSAFSLLLLTGVATASVHWPESWSSFTDLWMGYAITDKGQGNFKLPLLFALMLWPLVFIGPGRISLDAIIAHALSRPKAPAMPCDDALTIALVLLVFGLPLAQILPKLGYGLVALGIVAAAFAAWRTRRTAASI
jgi:putative oxidoreductase